MMDVFYEKVLRPILFKQDPETMHELALKVWRISAAIPPLRAAMETLNLVHTQKPIKVFGLNFPNQIGLAAGFDKDARCWRAAAAFGFGHAEIGTITRHKQSGNPKPRIFRYPESEAVVNACGFPNEGAEAIAKRLDKCPPKSKRKVPLGINIGKSKITPLDEAAEDYVFSFNTLADYADFFVINVSSPNTPELRRLQGADYLPALLGEIRKANLDRAKKLGAPKIPIVLKIAPDLTFREIDAILSILFELEFDGICATNTTVSRPIEGMESIGGLSGRPLSKMSLDIVKYISKATNGNLPIIGVGGVVDEDSAGRLANAGATLIQVYTGMIYRGPFFAKALANALKWRYSDWV